MTFMRRILGDSSGDGGRGSDDEALGKLVASGADMTAVRTVDFILTFPDERSARQVIAVLAGLAGDLRIGMTGGFSPRWLVRLTLSMTITLQRLTAMRSQLESIAEE